MIRRFFLLCLAVVASVPALRGDAAQPSAASLLSDGTPNLQADSLERVRAVDASGHDLPLCP